MAHSRKPLPVEHFEQVAHIIRCCRWMGTSCSAVVQQRFGVTDRTARRWFRECKNMGLISQDALHGARLIARNK